jgi:hypothetical protein
MAFPGRPKGTGRPGKAILQPPQNVRSVGRQKNPLAAVSGKAGAVGHQAFDSKPSAIVI